MEEKKDREPYQIRSHHLSRLLGVSIAFPQGHGIEHDDTEKLAAFTRGSIQSLMQKRTSATYESSQYASDIVGSDVEASPRFIEGLTKFYDEFLHLPDDFPVRIQSNVRDGICKSCAIGDHCSINMLENDAIEQFIYYAKQAGISEFHINNPGEKTMSLDTNMGNLRKVIFFVRNTKKCEHIDPNDFEELALTWNYSK